MILLAAIDRVGLVHYRFSVLPMIYIKLISVILNANQTKIGDLIINYVIVCDITK